MTTSMSTADPVRLGILGCAAAASYVVVEPARLGAGIEVVAIASRNRARAKDYATRNRIRKAQTYAEMLDDPELEAVYIPLPNSMHCEWTLRALDALSRITSPEQRQTHAVHAHDQ